MYKRQVISFFTFFIYLLFYNFQPVVAIRSLVTGAVLLILYNLVLLVPETCLLYTSNGVHIWAYDCAVTDRSMKLDAPVPVIL